MDELTPWADHWCKWCGDQLPIDRDPRRLFCDNDRACHTAYYNDLRAERLKRARAGKTCKQCGATFTRQKAHAIYCSRDCAVKAGHRAVSERRRRARADSCYIGQSV